MIFSPDFIHFIVSYQTPTYTFYLHLFPCLVLICHLVSLPTFKGHLPDYKVVTAMPAMIVDDDQPLPNIRKESKNGKSTSSLNNIKSVYFIYIICNLSTLASARRRSYQIMAHATRLLHVGTHMILVCVQNCAQFYWMLI